MKNKYLDLIEQTFDFPQEEFEVKKDQLHFRGIDLNGLVATYGTPLRFSFLPVIGERIEQCRTWFQDAFEKLEYRGGYEYCYCTKSSHFEFVIDQCLKHKVNIETSSAYDIEILIALHELGKLDPNTYIICNGYKTDEYVTNISRLLALGFQNVIPVIDSFDEFELLDELIQIPVEIGIRIASEEDPKFEFYTSRLGIGYKDIEPFYRWKIKNNKKFRLSFLHFFVNTGIRDNAYYWNELRQIH